MQEAPIVAYMRRQSGVNGALRPLVGASVTILNYESGDPVEVLDGPGGDALTPPFTTNAQGLVIHSTSNSLWTSEPDVLSIVGTKDGDTDTLVYPAEATGPGSVPRSDARADFLGDIEHAYSTYKVLQAGMSYTAEAAAATSHWLVPGQIAVSLNAAQSWAAAIPFDPADYEAGSRDLKLRLWGYVMTDSVAPGAGRTAGAYVGTATNNAAGDRRLSFGVIPTGADVAVLSPVDVATAGVTTAFDTGDFDAPAATILAVLVSIVGGALAAGASVGVAYTLGIRQV